MTKKKVWRYYCEHCRRGGCSASSISEHEKRCIYNPVRNCGLCGAKSVSVAPHIDILNNEGLCALRNALDCPACILAAIVQTRKADKDHNREEGCYDSFDYQKERDEFLNEKEAARRQEEEERWHPSQLEH